MKTKKTKKNKKGKAAAIDVADEEDTEAGDTEAGEAAPASGSPTLTTVANDVELLKTQMQQVMTQNAQIVQTVNPTTNVNDSTEE